MLSREQILGADDVKTQLVDVPEWGGSVNIKIMTGRERDAFERSLSDQAKLGEFGDNMRARLVAAVVVDDAGNHVFTAADVEALGKKNWQALERITKVASNLNLLTSESVEAIAKN